MNLPLYELIQLYMGHTVALDTGLSLQDCLYLAAKSSYLADGMASFYCETAS